MFSAGTLDLLIGMSFIFLLLSLLASMINEMVAARTNRRGNMLHEALGSAIGEENRNQIYCNRAVDVLGRAGESTPAPTSAAAAPSLPVPFVEYRYPSYIPEDIFAAAAMQLANPPDPIAKSLIASGIIAGTQPWLWPTEDAKKVEASNAVIMWYRAFGDRLSGQYKRITQRSLIIIGLIVVVAVNADSIRMFRTLYMSPVISSAIAEGAKKRANEISGQKEDDVRVNAALTAYRDSLAEAGLPLGWTSADSVNWRNAWPTRDFSKAINKTTVWNFLVKISGFFLSVMAIALGAPFWFDALSKLSSLRLTGPKPEEKKS